MSKDEDDETVLLSTVTNYEWMGLANIPKKKFRQVDDVSFYFTQLKDNPCRDKFFVIRLVIKKPQYEILEFNFHHDYQFCGFIDEELFDYQGDFTMKLPVPQEILESILHSSNNQKLKSYVQTLINDHTQ